jgi:hypothetical protein
MAQIEREADRPKRDAQSAFFDAIAKYNRPDALQVKIGGSYKPSPQGVAERVRHAARGLSSSRCVGATASRFCRKIGQSGP